MTAQRPKKAPAPAPAQDRLPLACLAAWLAARAAALAWLFFGPLQRLYFISGDYPSRVLMAWEWLRHPSVLLGGGIWLPASFYATGLTLALWPDPLAAPAVLHILMSTATLALIYAAARELFPGARWAGVWGAVLVSFDPLLTSLSLSGGASEIDAQMWLLGGAVLWLAAERTRRREALLGAAALLGIAAFTRHEMWCFLAWPSLALLPRLWRREREAAGALALMWLPAFAWIGKRATGGTLLLLSPSGILQNLRTGVPLAEGGAVGWTTLLWAYPRALLSRHRLLLVLAGLQIAAAVYARLAGRAEESRRPLAWVGWLSLALFGFCLTPIFSIVFAPTHERVALVLLLLLAPLAGRALEAMAGRGRAPAAALAAAAVALSWIALMRSRDTMAATMPVAPHVRTLALDVARLRPSLGPRRRLLIERAARVSAADNNAIWDYAVFEYAAAPYGVVDRPDRPLVRLPEGGYELSPDTPPSSLSLPRAELARFLDEKGIAFALVRSTASVERLRPAMAVLSSSGTLTLMGRPL